MKAVKQRKITFLVTATVGAIDPEDFDTQSEFDKQDARAMRNYLRDLIRERIDNAWQYGARVNRVSIKPVKE